MSFDLKLSPTTSYYLRKLLHQSEPKVLILNSSERDRMAMVNIDDILSRLYPETPRLAQSIQRLENLVSLHKTLYTQISLYPDYIHELSHLEQNIFNVLGLSLAEVY